MARRRRGFLRLSGNLKGAAVLMVAALLFAFMTALVKLAGERLHVTQVLFVRQVVMTCMVLPAILNHFPGCLRTTRPGLQIVRVGFALVAMLCGFTAVMELPLADATALGFAKSFFVTIFAILILGETVGPRRWGAVIVGFAGVLVMMRPATSAFDPVSLYAVAGAAAAGVVMVIIRILSRTDEPITILSYQAILVGIAIAIPAWLYWVPPTPWEWVLLAGIGVVSFAAQMCNIYAYKWGEASVLASLDYARLLWATLFGYLIFAHLPDVWTWVGAAIVVASSLYVLHRERLRNQTLVRGPNGRGFTNT